MQLFFILDHAPPSPQVHRCISIKRDAFHPIQNRQSFSPGCHALLIVLLFADESGGWGGKKNLGNWQSLLRRGPFFKQCFNFTFKWIWLCCCCWCCRCLCLSGGGETHYKMCRRKGETEWGRASGSVVFAEWAAMHSFSLIHRVSVGG